MKRKLHKFYRINYQIRAPQIRLLNERGKQLGVVSFSEALKLAQAEEKDLVEIAPKANPPVVKLIDFKKFKYLESKKQRQEKKRTKQSILKQIRLSPYMGEHDLKTRISQAEEFLKEGNQLKIVLQFKGRQIVHKEYGYKVIERAISDLKDVSKVVRQPYFEGRTLVTILIPEKKRRDKKNEKAEN